MRFNSITFIALFALVIVIHQSRLGWRRKKSVLLLASYVFYAAWNPPFVILIWISTLVDWQAAKGIASAKTIVRRRMYLLLSLVTNLGLLGFFKYGEFLLNTFIYLVSTIGIEFQPVQWGIVLPVGISFYTFQTLSYTIDVYRGKLDRSTSLLDFALFVTFFPQLVAGPIVRAGDFLPQLLTEKRASATQMGWGLSLLTIGLFEKVVLADAWMAPVADLIYTAPHNAGFLDAWLGTLAFSAQIFFDFSGYSTCAIGIALCMGFVLPDNFRFPYAAIGFSDFWKRWHISLSTWLRDYLYIPLGGNRKSRRRTYINLMMTMLLGGLWHGASWRFVAWGALHGLFLAVERWFRERNVRFPLRPVFGMLLTYSLVLVTWVFFRAESFDDAWVLLQAMSGLKTSASLGVGQINAVLVVFVTVLLLTFHWKYRNGSIEEMWSGWKPAFRALALASMLLAIILSPGGDRAFIYFQF